MKERKMEYEFKFTQEEAQILVDGLSELPIKQGIAVLQKLQTQFNKQKETSEEEVLTEEK